MVSGFFVKNTPFVRVAVAWKKEVQTPSAVLDTGFSGDLQVTPRMASDLGLQIASLTPSRMANGNIIQLPTALAFAAMEGAVNYIQVLVSESMPLVGISFLSKFGYKAVVDCKNKTVALEKVA